MFRLLGLALATSVLPLSAAAPDPVYKSLREATIAEAFVVQNFVLQRDAGTITLKAGSIAFTTPAMDRDTVAVFIGEGEFVLNPATEIEKNYLKSLTGQESVKESFDRALFCFTESTGKEIRSQAKTKAAETRLVDVLRDFRRQLRTPTGENIEAGILADLYRKDQPGFFSAYIHGRRNSDIRFHVRPRGAVPWMSPEEVFAINIKPLGVPDEMWYHAPLKSKVDAGAASLEEDKRIVEAQSYKVSTTIAGSDRFTGTTELKLRALTDGDRVIPFELLPTLRVSRVTEGNREIAFIQEDRKEDGSFHVILPQPLEKGSTHTLTIGYAGDKVVRKEGAGNFSVGARDGWYPNVNSFKDHAHYDLTFRIPKRYSLVSIGKLSREWTEQDFACSQWISDAPVPVAGFNYGTFKKRQVADEQAGMTIEGYSNAELPDYLKEAVEGTSMAGMSPSRLMDRTIAEATVALRIYNSWFGKSEFGRIAITQQPQPLFGQSWPSLVYLPIMSYLDSTQRWQLMGIQNRLTEFIDEVTSHEVAHQWWGHMVGWTTYRDQWISEGFADFSAGLYLQLTEKTPDKFLKYWTNARDRLQEKNNHGRRAVDAGPISLGFRLSSEKNPSAYNNVVYRKGGYVLHMLRQMMFNPKDGDKPFIAMMRDFVAQHMNKNASTASFQRVVEKHMNSAMNVGGNNRMDWFFAQWVDGTAIPRYKFDYTVTPSGEKFILKGTLAQSEVTPDFAMPVPVYLDFDGPLVRMGTIRMVGNRTAPFEVELPKKPKRVSINANKDILEQ